MLFHCHAQCMRTFNQTLVEALRVHVWGTDYHLFAFSLLMNKPVFQYNTFYIVSENSTMMFSLPDTRDCVHLAQRFQVYDPATRHHVLYCSNVNRALLASGNINALPLCLFNVDNQHWVAMLIARDCRYCCSTHFYTIDTHSHRLSGDW